MIVISNKYSIGPRIEMLLGISGDFEPIPIPEGTPSPAAMIITSEIMQNENAMFTEPFRVAFGDGSSTPISTHIMVPSNESIFIESPKNIYLRNGINSGGVLIYIQLLYYP